MSEKEEQNNKKDNQKKEGFFKKVYKSVVKIEKYPDMAAEGFPKAISYISKLVAILAIILCLGMMLQTYNLIQDGISYLKNDFPEFSYKDGNLDVNSEETITIENSPIGKIIVDTKTQDESQINQYIQSLENSGSGSIILQNKTILKNEAITGTIQYDYQETLKSFEITEFNKQDVINYATGSQIFSLYFSVFVTIFIYSFVMYLLSTLSNVVMLSLFGYLASWIARIKMRYVAIFNMSIYAVTLSVLLNILYIAINIFVDFNIEYFQVMYITVASIYLFAAIFILKSEFIKKQIELTKIAEAQAVVKKEIQEKEQEEKERQEKENKKQEEKNKKEENKDEKEDKDEKNEEDKEKKQEEQKDNNTGEEPEGSNA